jgi:hypothetical protein
MQVFTAGRKIPCKGKYISLFSETRFLTGRAGVEYTSPLLYPAFQIFVDSV